MNMKKIEQLTFLCKKNEEDRTRQQYTELKPTSRQQAHQDLERAVRK
jgi:hypothetical protein